MARTVKVKFGQISVIENQSVLSQLKYGNYLLRYNCPIEIEIAAVTPHKLIKYERIIDVD